MIDRLGWTLLHFLWQGAAIAFVLYLLLRIRAKATTRYLLAVIALAIMTASPVVTFFVIAAPPTPAILQSPDHQLTRSPDHQIPSLAQFPNQKSPDHQIAKLPDTSAPLTARLQPFLPWLVGTWLLGVSLLAIYHLGGFLAAQRLKTLRTTAPTAAAQSLLTDLLRRMRFSRPVKLLASTLVHTPMVLGYFRPVILIPASILSGLSPRELEAILAHELAHIRRHDYLINLLQATVETLLFYHPAIWWTSQQIRREREHCCDDIATTVCGDRLIYVQALASLEELRPAPSLALAATSSPLMARVRRLLNVPTPRSSPSLPLLTITALILLSLSFLLPTVWAQKPDNASDTKANDPKLQIDHKTHLSTLMGTFKVMSDALVEAKAEKRPASEISALTTDLMMAQAHLMTWIDKPGDQVSIDKLLHDVAFKTDSFKWATKLAAGDNITITSIRGTSPEIKPGNTYLISGKYTLASQDRATIETYVTVDAPCPSIPYNSQQTLWIDKGTGTFTLVLPFMWKGHPHVSFYPSDRGQGFGSLYFSSATPPPPEPKPAAAPQASELDKEQAIRAKMEEANKLSQAQDLEASADAYREVLKLDPDNESARLLLQYTTDRINYRAYQKIVNERTVPQASGLDKDINAKVNMLTIGTSQLANVVAVMGKPDKYIWGKQEFTEDKLPDQYCMVYPGGFHVVISKGKVWEIRFEGGEGVAAAYQFKNKLHMESTLDEAIRVLGPPTKTVVGEKLLFEDGVLYKNIDGKDGYGYYARPDQGIRLFFLENKVRGLYLTAVVKPLVEVQILVSPTQVSYQGKATTWDELAKLLEAVPDRGNTFLALKFTDQVTLKLHEQSMGRAIMLSRKLGFKYVSDTGILRPEDPAPAGLVPDQRELPLAAGDLIRVSIFGLLQPEREWMRDLSLNQDGEVTIPYLGKVALGGLTPIQAQDQLKETAIKKRILPSKRDGHPDDPQISVSILRSSTDAK